MPAGAVLSEEDKRGLKVKLKNLCEDCWTVSGYKKTSVKELCADTRIAVGTFYALFPTKEDLFHETIVDIQERLTEKFLDICKSNPNKTGFATAIKALFREYDTKPFLYDVNKPDYQSFVTKLSAEAMEKIKFDSFEFFRKAISIANLKLKIDEHKAYGVLGALIGAIYVKETLSVTHDYLSVLDFMADSLINSIFE